ncbi:hypothetical protein E2C01_044646 [Portunus trituberculatus]|uniref:Uncharacterized protein n=1 Tax=Portunus trituberculatus TaxID=210409 RepID=A0A5B7FW58_PORTR|nr:hypothetical protein [Portunus trituberculatus]
MTLRDHRGTLLREGCDWWRCAFPGLGGAVRCLQRGVSRDLPPPSRDKGHRQRTRGCLAQLTGDE